MQLNHRITFVWFFTLLFLVLLVIYLDGGLGNEPTVVFIVPMLFNLICAVSIGTKVAARFGISYFREAESIQPMTPSGAFYSIVMLTCKILFEIFLCCKLRGMNIDSLYIFLPLWIFVSIGAVTLFAQVLDAHLKTA